MLKLKENQDIYLKGGSEAVILLHSFTGTVRDVKKLANLVHNEGYTCYVPAYKGHGLSIESLIEYDINDWYQHVQESYDFLKESGFEKISVLGVSLGGLLSLKLTETNEINKCIVMSTPQKRTTEDIKRRLYSYGERINAIQGLEYEESNRQLSLIEQYDEGSKVFSEMIEDIMDNLKNIQVPVLIMYGELDEPSYKESAEYIFEQLTTNSKTLISYENATHLMTQSKDKEKIERDIIKFLNK